jgi:P22 coat protein - gene protein 5
MTSAESKMATDTIEKIIAGRLANEVDAQVMALYKKVWNWVGTPGNTLDSFADFAKAPERMDHGAVPEDERSAVLSPADYWALAGSQTALFMQPVATQAHRRGAPPSSVMNSRRFIQSPRRRAPGEWAAPRGRAP